jgi:hypothetical protein
MAIYFAYGSNMLSRRLRQRAPSAAVLGAAELRGYALRFRKLGRDGSAKADVVPADGASSIVHGVAFAVDAADLLRLDGFESGYRRALHPVRCGGRSVEAQVYFALPERIDERRLPHLWYRDLVVAGAREHGLPEEYVARIARHPVLESEHAPLDD